MVQQQILSGMTSFVLFGKKIGRPTVLGLGDCEGTTSIYSIEANGPPLNVRSWNENEREMLTSIHCRATEPDQLTLLITSLVLRKLFSIELILDPEYVEPMFTVLHLIDLQKFHTQAQRFRRYRPSFLMRL
nr:hypothetical protein CFP56_50459 [Quercus suber]